MDREVHATAGQEASSATGSWVERLFGANRKIHSIPLDKML